VQPGGAEDGVRAERRVRGDGWQGRSKESLIWVGRKAGGLAGPIRCDIWFLPYLMYSSSRPGT